MSDIELMAVIERYLNGEMTADERIRFEMLRRDSAEVDNTVKEHQDFTNRIKQYGERLEFENLLNAIHNEIDVQTLKEEFVHHPSAIVRLWRNHHSKISVAASIAIFAILGTLFFTGYLKTQDQQSEVVALRRKVDNVEIANKNIVRSTNALIKGLNASKKQADRSKYFIGTGFAVSPAGYVVTNFHVIKNADSVHLQNANGDSYRAKTVYSDPAHDIAILKITDPSFKPLGSLPYGFKRSHPDLGEDLFTIGYPRDDVVYNKGYLSAINGYNGDTTSYQVVIAVNYGNSGSPVLDNSGNVIGIISTMENHDIDGAAFAIKSKYLYKAISAIPADSLDDNRISLSSKSALATLNRKQQLKKLQNYVFMVKVY
jgi:serine protease Do